MTPLPAPPPALAPATVMRPRLERRLDACTARPVTVVTAPAGFGKTLLLASWAARNGAAWLQLHPVHCDVARLWRDVAHALQTLGLEASVDLPGPAALACRVHLRPDDPPQPRRTLVLDDLQVLRGPALRVVAALAAECGDHLAIAIASRCDPDLSLSRLRVEGRLGELRADDLAFT